MASDEILLFSSSFVISCGTVTIDIKTSRVLVIYLRDKDEYLLPKGRVNIGENWKQAAVRETFEETGVQVRLLPTTLETRATVPDECLSQEPVLHTEPFAMTRRLTTGGVEKTIYWFAGTADSTVLPVKGVAQPGEEDFETRWLKYDECLSRLTFANEKAMVQRLLDFVLVTPLE